MKLALIALALVAGPKAFAATDCNPYLVSPAGSEGEFHYVYPCGRDYTVHHRSCKEGEVAYGNELDASGNVYATVTLVCHNGSFAAPTREIKHRGCSEGEISYSSVLDPSGNAYQSVTLVCHNGRFVPAHR